MKTASISTNDNAKEKGYRKGEKQIYYLCLSLLWYDGSCNT